MSFVPLFGSPPAAGGGTPAWTPAGLSGLVLWLTAGPAYCFQDAGAAVACGDGDAVYTWQDRSGNAYHLTQPAAADRPVLRLVSGKWVVDADGTDDWMSRLAALTCGTVGLVATYDPATFNSYAGLIEGDTTGNETLTGNSAATDWFTGIWGTPGNTLIDGASSNVFLPAATPRRMVSWASPLPQANPHTVLFAGRSTYPPSNRWWDGSLRELVVTDDELGAPDQALLDAYLASL